MTMLGNALSLLYLAAFLAAGLRYAALLLPKEDDLTRAAAGASLALFAQQSRSAGSTQAACSFRLRGSAFI